MLLQVNLNSCFHFLVKGSQWFPKEMSVSAILKITYAMWAPCFKLSLFELHGQKTSIPNRKNRNKEERIQ